MENTPSRGFIHDSLGIKILILYILARLPEPVDFDTLANLSLCDDGIGYFDFTECAADLVKTGHISLSGGLYEITDKGRRNGAVTESGIPYPVRLRADRAASEAAAKMRRDQLITAYHTVRPRGGCTVHLALSDGVCELMKTELFAYNEKLAETMENSFRENAEQLYGKIIDTLTTGGDK